MTEMERREALRLIAAAPLAIRLSLSGAALWSAHRHVAAAVGAAAEGLAYQPEFFTAHEWQTVRLLVDLIIPADERSGSATDAGVPEFIDFLMTDPLAEERALEERQTAMRGGLAWIDAQCRRRFGRTFVDCDEAQRFELLDDIAYSGVGVDDGEGEPRDRRVLAPRHGRAFFNSFRDLTASGFWSSQMGVEDLEYLGNAATDWTGPPIEVLRKLGLEP